MPSSVLLNVLGHRMGCSWEALAFCPLLSQPPGRMPSRSPHRWTRFRKLSSATHSGLLPP